MRTSLRARVADRLQARLRGDDGFTLVEMMVSVVLVTGCILGLLGMLASSLQTHRGQRDEASAERAASTTIENARNLSFQSLLNSVSNPVVTVPVAGAHGMVFSTTTTVSNCSVTDRANACTAATGTTPTNLRLKVHVTWNEAGKAKSLDVSTGVSNLSPTIAPGSGSSTIGSLVGGATSTVAGLVASVSNLSVSPATASLNAQGHPITPVTVSATVLGLPNTTTFPMTWTDDSGSHQVTMTNSSGTTWTAALKTSDLTKVTAAGQTSTIAFTAVVPGSKAIPSTTLTLTPLAPPTLTCTSPLAIVLTLFGKTSAPSTLTCTSTGLATTDVVSVGYSPTGGPTTQALTTTTGTTWTATIPAGTALPVNPLTRFTFTGTRALDSATVSAAALSAVA